MSNGNGLNGSVKLLYWAGGLIGFCLMLYTIFHVPVLEAIAKEAEARAECDKKLEDKLDIKLEKILNKMDVAQIQQAETNTRLVRMEAKLENGR